MKKTIWIVILAMLLLPSACKRTDVTDPGQIPNAGFRVSLSGTANPSVLYVPAVGFVQSLITVTALHNDGTPVAGHNVILKIHEEFGDFANDRSVQILPTNANGVISTYFKVGGAALQEIGAEYQMYIQATLQDDGRVDFTTAEDWIPIRLITRNPDVDTLAATPASIPSVPVEGGTYTISVFNSTSANSISFVENHSPDDGIDVELSSGSTPSTITVTVDATSFARAWTITLTANDPDVSGSPLTITINQLGS